MHRFHILKSQLIRWRQFLLYVIFGGITTLVNLLTYYILARSLGLSTGMSTTLAWILSVLTAYLTNRSWVFGSQATSLGEILHEAASFFLCRFATGLLDLAIMVVSVDLLGFPDLPTKLVSNVLVIVLNYVASQFLIFHHSTKRK